MTGPTEAALYAFGGRQIVDALTDRTVTARGRERAERAPIVATMIEAERLLAETTAMVELMEERPDFDIEPSGEIGPLLVLARKGHPLMGDKLRAIYPTLVSAEKISLLFTAVGINDDSDHPLAVDFEPPVGLAGLIDESIDEEGAVRLDATPEIERLHRQVNTLKRQIRERAEAMLRDLDMAAMLQEEYVTLRENRFVLPVRAEHKNHVDGIVHGASQTGQTFFIEPKALVEMNNKLKSAEAELESEIHRLLARLSAMIGDEADAIELASSGLARLDLIHARARLSGDLLGVRPRFTDRVELKGLANPLMLLEGKEVVRNDVIMPEGRSILVLSGPNAGGKTVTMGGIGLVAIMARMGLFIPAAEGSGVPFYRAVHADIGDSQSIHDDLSTFSAHLTAVNRIVADASHGGLALLDELMVSTDPREGAALAVAVLDRLAHAGMDVVVTTHFQDLKILAGAEGGYYNLSMEFDDLEGRPTYRVVAGAPGSSSALSLAGRLGMDPAIVDAARQRLEGGDQRVEEALAKLREQTTLAERNRREAEAAKKEAARFRDEAAQLRRDVAEQKEEFSRTVKRKLAADVADARRQLAAMVDEARRSGNDKRAVASAREKVESLAADIRTATAPPARIDHASLRKGDTVYVTPLQRNGELVADPAEGKVDVDLGGLRLSVSLDDIVGLAKKGEGPAPTVTGKPTRRPDVAPSAAMAEIDIRGRRVDEGIENLERFLDQYAVGSAERVRIIHGKGTGALRSGVREYLANSPYIAEFFSEEDAHGGEGATVAILRGA